MKSLFALAALCMMIGVSHAQTQANPQVWGCNTNCTNTANWNNWSWLARDPAPTYVAATDQPNVATGSGSTLSCRNFWNVGGAVTRRTSASVKAQLALDPPVNVCVAGRRSTSEDTTLPASTVFTQTAPPPPVDCEVSAWGACSITTGLQTRTVTRQPANGGAACPALTQPCPEPLPRVSYTFGINRNPILAGETATITWTSQNAVTCTIQDGTDPAESVALSGTRTVGPYTAQNRNITLVCGNVFGSYFGTVNLVVAVPPPRSPACWPHLEDALHLRAAPLTIQDTGFDLKATWFCAGVNGAPPRQMSWVTTYEEVAKRIESELRGEPYDEDAAAAQCEATCIDLPPGALKDELDAFAAQYTAEQIGVIN